ncbi:MAG TPA: DEAD/DEAH box helicase [Candidatus Kapabacteria bacterium]|nr:DEAD/DEAH box helicase [Candidatus Kapabacteria bacterium]
MQEPSENTQQILIEPERTLPDFTFDQLPPAMREPIEALGWRTPMPVQAKAIPYLLDKRDMIVQSRTGSGKTGAFLMPLLMRIDPARRYPQALVLVPTRELAMQVHKEFLTLSKAMDLTGALVYGGVGYGTQLQSLREGAQVIIGTPGRVLDHIGRRSMNLDRLGIIVFDEADEMLSMGFYPDMRELRRYLPRERSSWMFSATMPYKVQMLAREFLHEPEFLSLSAGNVSVSTMEHRFYEVPPLEKDLMLMRLIEFEHPESAIIFCNTKVDVEYVATVLRNYGYNVDLLSGDLDQKSRERAMERIRRGESRFLVATDVAARGIDISDLSHVFQYDVPKDPDSYIHRAGRTARAGNTGVVVTLVANMSEKSDLKKIARKYNVEFVELPLPSQQDLEERMAERLVVILEDRFRGLPRLHRERMKRFSNLVRSLAENEEEHLLLAMLLDDNYQATYHHVAPSPQEEAPQRAEAPPQRSEGTQRAEGTQRSEARRESPRGGDQSRSSGSSRGSDGSQAGDDAQPAGEHPRAADASGHGEHEGERKKKKRRRKKRRGGGHEGGASEHAPGASAAELPPSAGGDAGTGHDARREERGDAGRGERREERAAEAHDPENVRQRPASGTAREERKGDVRDRDEVPRREKVRQEPARDASLPPAAEQKPAEQKPQAQKPAEQKPAEQKPQAQTPAQKDRAPKEERRHGRDERGHGKKPKKDDTLLTGDGLWFDSIEVIEPEPVPAPESVRAPEPPKKVAESRSAAGDAGPAQAEPVADAASAKPKRTAKKVAKPAAEVPHEPAGAEPEAKPKRTTKKDSAAGEQPKDVSPTAEAPSAAPAAKRKAPRTSGK